MKNYEIHVDGAKVHELVDRDARSAFKSALLDAKIPTEREAGMKVMVRGPMDDFLYREWNADEERWDDLPVPKHFR